MVGTWPEKAEIALRAHVVDHPGRTRQVAAAPVVRGADPTHRTDGTRTPCAHSSLKASAKTVTSASTNMLQFAISSRRTVLASSETSVVLLI